MTAKRLLASLSLLAACSSETSNPPPIDPGPDGTGGPVISTDGTSTGVTDESGTSMGSDSGTGTGSDSGTSTADDTGSGTTAGDPPVTCEDISCSGHGGCKIGDDGDAFCACDQGYVLDAARETCVVDESCVKVRFLEDRCRQLFNGPPAVSLFFAVDFCSGTAVTSEKFEELGLSFQVLEDGTDIAKNVESESTIVPTSVESYVTLVVDVSESVTTSQDLSALVAELRAMVASLQPGMTDPDVYVSVYAFGRFVREYVPFTRDLATVDAALAQIELDPDAILSLVGGDGTALYEAVTKGINRTQRIRDMRDAVSNGGVLSTGTVVVVTDGMDSSGGELQTSLIDGTLNQVISIGISNDIEDADLEQIGRDGSFLAPEPADWTEAFAEVAQRVEEYPDRAYLLAYCSSTTTGQHDVEVTITGPEELTVEHTAVCEFDANVFSSDPGQVCGLGLFTGECDTQGCGGLTACGACSDDQCCTGSTCVGPSGTGSDPNLGCAGFDSLCAAGEVCVVDTCEAGAQIGEPCGNGCVLGTWCDPETMQCVAGTGPGMSCASADECASQNCQVTNPNNPFEMPVCQPPALAYDTCAPDMVVCEDGAFCDGTTCLPQRIDAEPCTASDQCRSGSCEMLVTGIGCAPTSICFWAWEEKVPN